MSAPMKRATPPSGVWRLPLAALAVGLGMLGGPGLSLGQPGSTRAEEHLSATGDDQLGGYARIAPIVTEGAAANGATAWRRLVLPLAVLQASQQEGADGPADLRLFGADGRARPHAWAEPRHELGTRETALPIFAWPAQRATPGSARTDDASGEWQVDVERDGRVLRIRSARGRTPATTSAAPAPVTWLIDASAASGSSAPSGSQAARLLLDWTAPADGLNLALQLEGSDDARRWQPVTEGSVFELPSRELAAPAVRTLEWPAGRRVPRYLRLHADGPLPLTAARLQFAMPLAEPGEARVPLAFEPVPAQTGVPAHWQLDLGGAVALQALQLPLEAPNQIVAVTVEQRRQAAGPWVPVASGTTWRLQRDGRDQQAPALAINAAPARWWRVLPDRRTPVDASRPWTITLSWRPPALVFIAEAAPLTLAVGRAQARSAALPIAQLMPGWQPGAEHRLPEATLGALAPPPAAARASVDEPGDAALRKQRWLWAGLAAAVLALGAMAWRLHRELSGPRDATPGAPPSA